MAVLRILLRLDTPCRLRLMAASNVLACAFVTIMTLLTSFTSFVIIVPVIFRDAERSLLFHRSLIAYLFINVCGNFLLCLWVNTSTAASTRKGTGSQRRKIRVLGKSSTETGNGDCVSTDSADHVTGTGKRENPGCSDVRTSSKRSFRKRSNLKKAAHARFSESHVQPCNSEAEKPHTKTHDLVEDQNGSNNSSAFASSHAVADDVANLDSEITSTSPSADTVRSFNKSKISKPSKHNEQKMSQPEAPERSHECKLCGKRILRRDHHCFFMTVCIGYHNHKHFIFFCLYMTTGALYAVILTVRFLHILYNVQIWGPQTFVLLLLHVLYKICVMGDTPDPLFLLLLCQLYVCLAVGLVTGGLLYWHVAITVNGQTTHEATRGDVRYGGGVRHNLRDVLGHYWPLLFLLPLPLPQAGDGRSYIARTFTTPTTTTCASAATTSSTTTAAT